jgi:hypothetical protein
VTPAHLYDLYNQRALFSRSVSERQTGDKTMSVASIELQALFYATDHLLAKLDDCMLAFRASNPQAWSLYQSARGLDSSGRGMAHDYEDSATPRAIV